MPRVPARTRVARSRQALSAAPGKVWAVLHVHRAAGAATLVEALAGLLAEPSGDVFAPEVVAVPARGVERWITQRLSHVLGAGAAGDGVCANVVFPSPAALLDGALAAVCPLPSEADPWDPGRAVWPLLEVLDGCLGEPWCEQLTAHLEPGGRRYATAARLAGLFDRYGRERPELVRAWAAKELTDHHVPPDLAWQPELWRRLRERIGVPSPAERLPEALEALRDDPAAVPLPARLSLFGPTRMSAARLAVLAALAAGREVHLWVPHASPALWAAVAAGRGPQHPVLASMAVDVTAFQRRLTAAAPGHTDVHHPGPPRPDTLLGRLQDDLAADRARAAAPRTPPAPGDRSVAVHACHGRARQVEVLREALLGLLAADPTLEPRDILVMCPDVEEFAPLVAAAFGLATEGSVAGGRAHPAGRLRVRLADRSLRQANPLLGTLATLLDLATGRVTASAVLDLAATAPVRRRFGFDDDELARLREWVADAGIRWGLDGPHRQRFKLGAVEQGTWRDGLDRLLLGVAMAPGERWLGGAVPLADVDSAEIDLAGRLAEFVDRLADALTALSGEREVGAWADLLAEAVLAVAEPAPGEAWQSVALGRELADVKASAAEFPGVRISPVDLAALLRGRLAGRPTRASFRTGTLTVATLVPMRSVPHRVVVLLGLDEATFPRCPVPDGDDLLARAPRPGERDPRTEDRQLLLDAVCAAQEHLLVLYTGADERTGAPVPPAVPLGELLDALDGTALAPGGRRVRDLVTVRHPLQPFDPRNFAEPPDGCGPAFDLAALAGARALVGPRTPVPPLAGGVLPPAEAAEVTVDELARLFEHPARGFLRQRLGIGLAGDDPEPADALPLELAGLDKWEVGERFLDARLRGVDVPVCLATEARRGMLPPGEIGKRAAQAVGRTADQIVALARAPLPAAAEPWTSPAVESVDVDLALPSGHRLTGTVACGGEAEPGTLLRVSFSTLAPKHRIRAWVELLAVTAAGRRPGWRAVVVGKHFGGARRSVLGPVGPEMALAALADLAVLRDQGLREPLPAPVRAAESYARRRRTAVPEQALEAAAQEWVKKGLPEQGEPAHVLLYGAEAPFEVVTGQLPGGADAGPDTGTEPTRFGTLALRIWVPLLRHEELGS